MGRLRSAKKWSCKIVDSDGFVLRCLDLTFHGQRHIFRVRLQPLCSGSSVCLGSNRSLANRADATVEVVLDFCRIEQNILHIWFGQTNLYQIVSKCIFFSVSSYRSNYRNLNNTQTQMQISSPESVLPSWCQISTTKKTLRQLQLWDSYKPPWSKTDLSKDCALTEKVKLQSCRERPVFWMQSRFVLCLQVFAFLMVDLTFHGQWHIFGVRLRPLCRGSFVCLGSNRSLANHVKATAEVVLQKCPPNLRPDLYNKGGHATITTLRQLPATMVYGSPK